MAHVVTGQWSIRGRVADGRGNVDVSKGAVSGLMLATPSLIDQRLQPFQRRAARQKATAQKDDGVRTLRPDSRRK